VGPGLRSEKMFSFFNYKCSGGQAKITDKAVQSLFLPTSLSDDRHDNDGYGRKLFLMMDEM
jgi:hypothetical protein